MLRFLTPAQLSGKANGAMVAYRGKDIMATATSLESMAEELLGQFEGGNSLPQDDVLTLWAALFDPLGKSDLEMARQSGFSEEQLSDPWRLVTPPPVAPALYALLMSRRNGGELRRGERVIEL